MIIPVGDDRSGAPSPIEAVLFDLDGRLYAHLPMRRAMMGEMGLICGMRALTGGAAAGMPCVVLTRTLFTKSGVVTVRNLGELPRVLEPIC